MNIVKRRYVTGYAVFSLFFFLALFSFTMLSIQTMTITNRETAEKNFMEIRNKVVLAFSENGNLRSGNLEKVFDNVTKEPRLLALVLYSTEQGIIKVKAKDSFYIKNFKGDLGSKSYILEYNTPPGTWASELPITLKYENMEIDAFLSGLYVILGSKDYTALLWQVLYILLGFLLFTILVMIFISTRAKGESEKVFPVPEAAKTFESKRKIPPLDTVEENRVSGSYPLQRQVLSDEGVVPTVDSILKQQEGLGMESPFDEQAREFSPATRLGSPLNLINRLRFELERATAFDQDLVVAVLKIQEAKSKSDLSHRRHLGELILKYFPFQDLAFEYSDTTFVIIIPDQIQEQALKNINSLSTEAGEKNITLWMGLSARQTRVVTAEALLGEAEDSLAKAETQEQN